MSLNVCPAAIVAAPVEIVWDLIRLARLSEWADGQVDAPVPEGPAVGLRLYFPARLARLVP